jgi:hypothetical protein
MSFQHFLTENWPLALGWFLAALSISLFVLRSRRIRRLKKTLSEPAFEYGKKVEGKRRKLKIPKGTQLNSKLPLEEVLYEDFRVKPKTFLPESLAEILPEENTPHPEKLASLGISPPKPAPISDEQKINQLVGLQAYPSDPNYMPVEALATSFLVNLLQVVKGKKQLSIGVEHAVLDSLGAGGGFAGAKLGGVVGLGLAPFVATVAPIALPAFMLAGAWIGARAGKKLGDRMKARKLYSALKQLRKVSNAFRKYFLKQFPVLMKQLDREFESKIAFTRELYVKRQGRLRRFFFPDLLTVFLGTCQQRIKIDWDLKRKEWKQIKAQVRVMTPVEFVALFDVEGDQNAEKMLVPFPELLAQYRSYQQALKEVQEVSKEMVA